ncbi:unnamed protein product, partial [Mesorhabditis belari]|uniref:SAND domain-containing protein n=1 Tax=Mesorhabditis belari TaxID=2138241 RepID=A0AAF3FPX0_9BILA
MHIELFLCPGIHQPCIELNGEMVSPKEFTVRANKDKQKDWKGSIRIGKSNLRTLMELRTFDFFNHSHYCSAKCQSRNYITPKSERVNHEGNEREFRRSSIKSLDHFIGIHPPQTPTNFALIKPDPESLSHLVQMSTVLNNNNGLPPMIIHNHNETLLEPRLPTNEEILHRLPPTPDNVGRIMHSDATTFWSQMQQVGLLDDIVDTMLAEVDTVRNETRVHNITPRVCGTLSRLCSALDLTANVAARLRSRHTPINANVLPPPEITHIGERKRSLDEGLMVRPLANQMIPELKRPRTHYPPVIQSPLIEALLKVQTTYQLHQTPFANMDLLLKFASQPPQLNIGGDAGSAGLPQSTTIGFPNPSALPTGLAQLPTTLTATINHSQIRHPIAQPGLPTATIPSQPAATATPIADTLLKIQ